MRTKRKSKAACLLLACLVGAAVLPSCAAAGVAPGAGGDSQVARLTWYMPGYPTQMTADGYDAVMAELNGYLGDKAGVSLEMKLSTFNEYDKKCSTVISSGEAFDLMFTADWINTFATNAGSKAYLPLNDYLEKYAPDIMADIPDYMWKTTTIGGQIYAMPARQNHAKNDGFFLRANIAEALNVIPSSYDNGVGVYSMEDVEILYDKIMAYDPEIIPDDCEGTLWVRMDEALELNMLSGFSVPGAVRFADESTVIDQFKSQEFLDYCKMMRRWQEKGYVQPDMATYATMAHQLTIDRRSDKHVTYRSGYTAPNVAALAMSDCGWQETPVPIITSGKYTTSTGITQSLTAVGVNSRHPEKAIEAYNLFYTDEYAINTLLYGIEGAHYTKVSATEVEVIPGTDYVNPLDNFTIANQFITWVQYGVYPADIWEQIRAFGEDSIESALLGFTFDSTGVRNQVANCSAIYDEYKYPLLCGAVDPETVVPEMVARMEQAGSGDIIREMQRQVDAFLTVE